MYLLKSMDALIHEVGALLEQMGKPAWVARFYAVVGTMIGFLLFVNSYSLALHVQFPLIPFQYAVGLMSVALAYWSATRQKSVPYTLSITLFFVVGVVSLYTMRYEWFEVAFSFLGWLAAGSVIMLVTPVLILMGLKFVLRNWPF